MRQAVPTAEDYDLQKERESGRRSAITVLPQVTSWIGGDRFFLYHKGQTDRHLPSWRTWIPADVSTPIGGADLHRRGLPAATRVEPWGALIVNLILAAINAALALWHGRSPCRRPDRSATYVVVIAANAISDPRQR